MSQEWVDTIGASRDRNWIAGADENNRTTLIPLGFDGATPALEGLCHRVTHGMRLRPGVGIILGLLPVLRVTRAREIPANSRRGDGYGDSDLN